MLLYYKAQVGTTELAPGNYTLQWQGTGDNVQVKVLQNGKVVATASAKLVENAKLGETNGVTYRVAGDKRLVEEIKLSHGKESLVFSETQSQIATQ